MDAVAEQSALTAKLTARAANMGGTGRDVADGLSKHAGLYGT
jgi:hypothetical protein